MPIYPILKLARDEQLLHRQGVDVEKLNEQLIPIRDVLIKLFDAAPAKSRGELHRLELGLAITKDGNVAFTSGTTKPSLTLTLESRQRSPSTRSTTSRSSAAKKPDVVEIA
jgi:hypothetical protein